MVIYTEVLKCLMIWPLFFNLLISKIWNVQINQYIFYSSVSYHFARWLSVTRSWLNAAPRWWWYQEHLVHRKHNAGESVESKGWWQCHLLRCRVGLSRQTVLFFSPLSVFEVSIIPLRSFVSFLWWMYLHRKTVKRQILVFLVDRHPSAALDCEAMERMNRMHF